MKRTILITLLTCMIGAGTLFAQFVVKPTFFETTGVSNQGVISGYEAQAGPYSLWNADDNTFIQIGGAAPGQGIGGAAKFSGDGSLLSGTTLTDNYTASEWEKLNTGYNYIFRGLEFPEQQNHTGYAAGQSLTYNGDGIVIKTNDGGETWEELWTGVNQGIEAISFPDLYTGYVGGWNEYFAKTTDGGYTWTPLTPGTDVFVYTDIFFKDVNNGVVTAQTNTGVGVYTTTDGGATWTTGSGLSGVPYKLTHVADNIYFLVTNGGDIQKSEDNGASWTTVFSDGGLMLGIEFYNSMIGIATAENNVYKTIDGGITWTEEEVIEGALWRDVAWLDEDHVTLVGTPELIFASEDGGDSWPINNLDTTTLNEALYEVLFTENGTGFIIGSQGVLFRKATETNTYSIMSMYNVDNAEWTVLGSFDVPVDGNLSSGYNISGDGNTVVGSSYVEPTPGHPGLAVHATAWTETTGLIDLGSLFTDTNRSTRADAVSHDGSVIVGWQDFNGPWKSAVWRRDVNGDYGPNEYLLVDSNGDPNDEMNQLGQASAVSADGNWIGGHGDFANNEEPWIWSEESGYISLGSMGGTGRVSGINHDGSIVIGWFDVGPWDPTIPFIWTTTGGLQNLNTFITDTLGYTMSASPIYIPNNISANGQFITGWGYDPTIGPFGDLFTYRLEMPTAPVNNSCEDAEALMCGDLVTNSTIFGSDSGGNASPDVYYTYTGNGTAEQITINVCGPDTNFETTVRVFSDCTLSNQIAINDSSCVNQPELTFDSDGTSTYVIMIEGYNNTAAGNFQLAISCETIILGTIDHQTNNIALYPNPVQNVLQISSKVEMTQADVYSISGAMVLSKNLAGNTSEIDFSELTTGVYFIKIASENSVETFKIIKE